MKKKVSRPLSVVPGAGSAARPAVEWVGGVRDLPDVAALGKRMSLVLWVAAGETIAAEPVPRATAKQALAMIAKARAAAGGPPSSVRVASHDELARVRAVLGREVTVRVGPTPEIDAAFDELMDKLGMLAAHAEAPSDEVAMHPLEELLELSTRAPGEVARFVTRALALHRAAPWTIVPGDGMVFILDAPSRPWKQVTVKVLGQNGEVYGCAICRSSEDCLTIDAGDSSTTLDHEMEVLDFSAVDDMPRSIRKRVDAQRWPLGRDEIYPLLMGLTPRRTPRHIGLGDVERATFVATALAAFLAEHREGLREDMYGVRQSATLVDGEGVVVRYVDLVEVVDPLDEDGDEDLWQPLDALSDSPLVPEIDQLFRRWTRECLSSHAAEMGAAIEEVVFARRGVRSVVQHTRDDLVTTSLPPLWGAFFRPWRSAATGLSSLDATRGYDDLRAAREAFGKSRLLYAEYLGEVMPGLSRLRDLGDGEVYDVVGLPEAQRRGYTRWMRALLLVVPIGGGRWYPPSLVLASEGAAELSFHDLVERARGALEALRRPLGALEGEALRAALRRELGVVYGVLYRHLDEVVARPPKKRFLTNTDGERAVFVTCEVKLRGAVKQVMASLDAAPEFTRSVDRCWELLDRTRTAASPGGEFVGQIMREGRGWRVRGNSPQRIERLLDRLEAVLGERPVEVSREVMEPWRNNPGLAATREEADEVVQIASGPATSTNVDDPRLLVLEALHRSLDQRVETIDGVPRALAATPEGRERVEQWLRSVEQRGLPPNVGARLLDLDSLRRELGMPTVV